MTDKPTGGITKLIEALEIVKKYEDPAFPSTCAHDTFYLCVDAKKFSLEDITRLDELGFFVNDEGGFTSYKYGSC